MGTPNLDIILQYIAPESKADLLNEMGHEFYDEDDRTLDEMIRDIITAEGFKARIKYAGVTLKNVGGDDGLMVFDFPSITPDDDGLQVHFNGPKDGLEKYLKTNFGIEPNVTDIRNDAFNFSRKEDAQSE